MNLSQLEYILAVDKHRHFVKAADACFVTQATLSMMIRKLEDELGIKIFDRSRQPVMPTEQGQRVIAQAQVILREAQQLREMSTEISNKLTGEIRLGVIPTLAPYLLPMFLNVFLRKYPGIKMHISELTTDEIIRKLERNELDAGLAIGSSKVLLEASMFSDQKKEDPVILPFRITSELKQMVVSGPALATGKGTALTVT